MSRPANLTEHLAGTRARHSHLPTAQFLDIALGRLINALNPSQIIVGGEISAAWEVLEPIIRAATRARAFTEVSANTPVIPESTDISQRLLGGIALVAAPQIA